MKKCFLFVVSLYVAAPLYAVREHVKRVLSPLDYIEPTSGCFPGIGMVLIDQACNDKPGLTSAEKLFLYRQLLDITEEILASMPHSHVSAIKSISATKHEIENEILNLVKKLKKTGEDTPAVGMDQS